MEKFKLKKNIRNIATQFVKHPYKNNVHITTQISDKL